jgi:hypothetical protein
MIQMLSLSRSISISLSIWTPTSFVLIELMKYLGEISPPKFRESQSKEDVFFVKGRHKN